MKKKPMVKKIMKIATGLLIIGVISFLSINGYVRHSAGKRIATLAELEDSAEEKADAIIVLGAWVKPDGQMSKMLKERVETGIELYRAGLANKIIMSGDHGQTDYDEVNVMKAYAIERGVPSTDIFMDHAGFSTYETMYRAKEVFQVGSAIIVTQEYHLYRAVYNAESLGIKTWGISCDTAVYAGDSSRRLREAAARVKDFGYSIIKPAPTYLGDAIPVSGSGDVTNDL